MLHRLRLELITGQSIDVGPIEQPSLMMATSQQVWQARGKILPILHSIYAIVWGTDQRFLNSRGDWLSDYHAY